MRGEREIGPRRPGLLRPGQRGLRRFDFHDFLRAAPGQLSALSSVPDSRVSLQPEGEALVACDCGALPEKLPPALSTMCECGRLFVHLGRGDVRGCRPEPGPPEDDR